MTFQVTILTMTPEAFPGPLGVSVIGQALRDKALWSLNLVDIRAFSEKGRGFLDDTPAGGGAGQILKADVLAKAFDSLKDENSAEPDLQNSLFSNRDLLSCPKIYMSARGRRLDQHQITKWSQGPGLVILCGRFEGVDQRFIQSRQFEEVCVGDFVLAGGEVAAMSVVEACVRLLPGVLGNQASIAEESFQDGLLEHPHYTRPRVFEGLEIPDVLLSGHHDNIKVWRETERKRTTKDNRPDLWAEHVARKGATHLQPRGKLSLKGDRDERD